MAAIKAQMGGNKVALKAHMGMMIMLQVAAMKAHMGMVLKLQVTAVKAH